MLKVWFPQHLYIYNIRFEQLIHLSSNLKIATILFHSEADPVLALNLKKNVSISRWKNGCSINEIILTATRAWIENIKRWALNRFNQPLLSILLIDVAAYSLALFIYFIHSYI